jgi:hypothetical protein
VRIAHGQPRRRLFARGARAANPPDPRHPGEGRGPAFAAAPAARRKARRRLGPGFRRDDGRESTRLATVPI